MRIETSAPGSLMIMGEHAVLRANQALVCAIDKRIYVSLEPRSDRKVEILADRLGSYEETIDNLEITPPFTFALTAIKAVERLLPSGCTIKILTDFPENIGFGSSAAVVVAITAALSKWLNLGYESDNYLLFKKAKETVTSVQGLGSGADLAASIWGGTLYFRNNPIQVESLPYLPSLVAAYCGFKTKTPQVVQQTLTFFKDFPDVMQAIDHAVDACVNRGKVAIQAEDWESLGKLFNVHHELLSAYNVTLPIIDSITWRLREIEGILGTKISGSGLGDCIIGLGTVDIEQNWPERANEISTDQMIPLDIAKEGVLISEVEAVKGSKG